MYFQTVPTQVEDIVNVDDVATADILWAGLIFLLSIIAAFVVRRIMRRWLKTIPGIQPGVAGVISRTTSYGIVVAGVVFALPLLGFSTQPLVLVLLLLAVIIFFAGRPLLESFAAGLILQMRTSFGVGDLIQHKDLKGVVVETDMRTTIIDTPVGERIAIPNIEMLRNPIINLTALGALRTTVDVGVAYGTDLDRAVDVIATALHDLDQVLDEPPPLVAVANYEDSAIRISVWCWHAPSIMDEFLARDEIIRSIDRALGSAGIVIAFPQRDIWLREAPTDETETP